jgi:hypothetical protein
VVAKFAVSARDKRDLGGHPRWVVAKFAVSAPAKRDLGGHPRWVVAKFAVSARDKRDLGGHPRWVVAKFAVSARDKRDLGGHPRWWWPSSSRDLRLHASFGGLAEREERDSHLRRARHTSLPSATRITSLRGRHMAC